MMRSVTVMSSVSRLGGGLFDATKRLSQELQAGCGVEVEVLGLEDEFAAEDAPSWSPLSVTPFPVVGPKAIGFAPGLAEGLRRARPEIAHVHGLWTYPSLACLSWSRQTRTPYVVSPHGMLDPWAVRNSRWKKRMVAAAYQDRHLRRAACVRALCEAEARAIRAYGLRNPIAVIPNGVDLPDCAAAVGPPPWLDVIGPEREVLLFLSRIHPKKGLVPLIEGWAAAGRAMAGWALVVAGWEQGGHRAELEALVGRLGLGGSVAFVGPQFGTAKSACFRHASAFVLPSFSEGLPMVVLEAWAHGLAVLMTSACNLPEGFAADAAVELQPSPAGCAEALRRLAAMTAAERAAMGARGERMVRDRFTWPHVAGMTRELYEWVLGRGEAPSFLF